MSHSKKSLFQRFLKVFRLRRTCAFGGVGGVSKEQNLTRKLSDAQIELAAAQSFHATEPTLIESPPYKTSCDFYVPKADEHEAALTDILNNVKRMSIQIDNIEKMLHVNAKPLQSSRLPPKSFKVDNIQIADIEAKKTESFKKKFSSQSFVYAVPGDSEAPAAPSGRGDEQIFSFKDLKNFFEHKNTLTPVKAAEVPVDCSSSCQSSISNLRVQQLGNPRDLINFESSDSCSETRPLIGKDSI